MVDIGVSCTKKTYGRTAGRPLVCRPDLVQDGALCYPECEAGTHGVGPMCWGNCPSEKPVKCGALCLPEGTTCSNHLWGLTLTGLGITGVPGLVAGTGLGGLAYYAVSATDATTDLL